MHSPEQSDGPCYLLRMPLGEFAAPKPFRPCCSTDHRMIEIREEIYREVLLEKCYVEIGELKSDEIVQAINDSDDESDYSDLSASMDDILSRTNAEFGGHQGIPPVEQAGNTGSGPERDIDEEDSIEGETVCKRRGKSEETGNVRDKDMESECNRHVLAPVTTARQHKGAIENGVALGILRTCRQIYAEASPLFYSMLEVIITPEQVVDLDVGVEYIQRRANMKPIRPHYEEGIFPTLGWDSQLDFAAWSKIEKIHFEADYNFLLIDKSPSLHVDEHFHTHPIDEARLMLFMKRTQTVENLVSLLATLPRLRQLSLSLAIEVRPRLELPFDDEDEEAEILDFKKMSVANERATELFIECGMLDPLRKLSNVQKFEFEVQSESSDDDVDFTALKPKHARMVEDLKGVIEHNWVAKNSIH